MKRALTYFIHTIGRQKAATLLNLIGLVVAFTSFIIIVVQVRYELTFDSHYRNGDRIFRVEAMDNTTNGVYESEMSRPFGEKMIVASADIEVGGMIQNHGDRQIYDLQKGVGSISGSYPCYQITPGILDVFEFECTAGDFGRLTEPNTVIISERTASALFAGRDPIGSQLAFVGAAPCEVIAVYRDFPDNSRIQPMGILYDIGELNLTNAGTWIYNYYIRLQHPEQIDAITTASDRIMKEIYSNFDDIHVRFSKLYDTHFLKDVADDSVMNMTIIYSLGAVAVLILWIAMINFINFSIALFPLRIRYVNTQKIFGGSNAGIRRNMIGYSLGLTLIAFIVALLVVEALSTTSLTALLKAKINLSANLPIILLTAVVAVVCGVLSGIYPAYYSTSIPPAFALKGSFGLSNRGRYLRNVLIAFQFVISIVLIVVALSVDLQNRYMRNYDMGFHRENILTTQLPTSFNGQQDALAAKLKRHPRIVDVTFAQNNMVETGRGYATSKLRGQEQEIRFDLYQVAVNFISFMGLDLMEGRDFVPTDMKFNMFIFNQEAQTKYGLRIGDVIWGAPKVIGLVENFHAVSLQKLVEPLAFYIAPNSKLYYMMIKIDTPQIGPVIAFIQQTMRGFDPLAQGDVRFLDERIGNLYQKEANFSKLITLFCLLSVLISVMGVFGLVLFETQYRRKEIGLRKIHGSTVGEVLWMFNKRYVGIVGICFIIASPIAYYIVKQWLATFAYQMPLSLWIFGVALLIIWSITLLTISIQSYKTATENPIKAIKTE